MKDSLLVFRGLLLLSHQPSLKNSSSSGRCVVIRFGAHLLYDPGNCGDFDCSSFYHIRVKCVKNCSIFFAHSAVWDGFDVKWRREKRNGRSLDVPGLDGFAVV